ncbi:MAG: DUF2442 domain-containing protein [Candidatus Latescibacter sp.]|nr:DUF2442 domain-containing protein [Candidatus Latescibacter sp.]
MTINIQIFKLKPNFFVLFYKIQPSGYGIHWPLIDEDIAIDGLLGIVHTRESIG